jgi:hypothetical protein
MIIDAIEPAREQCEKLDVAEEFAGDVFDDRIVVDAIT